MIRIHTQSIGQPQIHQDDQGQWASAIFRTPIGGPVELQMRGLVGDQVADTANHGSLNQAVCCHPLAHYAYWNRVYGLTDPDRMLGAGSVGENWTLTDLTEADVCIGDTYTVGTARVQVSGPRYPCTKQERKVGLPGFLKRTKETLRTGFYLRVLTSGVVQAGDEVRLAERLYPDLTVQAVNACVHQAFDPVAARRALAVPELAAGWKRILQAAGRGELD